MVTSTGDMTLGEGRHYDTMTRTTIMITAMQDRLQERFERKRTTTSSDYIIRLTDRLLRCGTKIISCFSQKRGVLRRVFLGRRLPNGKPQERLRFRALRGKTLAFKRCVAISFWDLKISLGARACVPPCVQKMRRFAFAFLNPRRPRFILPRAVCMSRSDHPQRMATPHSTLILCGMHEPDTLHMGHTRHCLQTRAVCMSRSVREAEENIDKQHSLRYARAGHTIHGNTPLHSDTCGMHEPECPRGCQ